MGWRTTGIRPTGFHESSIFTYVIFIAGGKRVMDETRNSAVSVKRLMPEVHNTLLREEGLGNAWVTRSTPILVSFENFF